MAGMALTSALPDLDEVTVGVTQVAADLRATIDRLGEDCAPLADQSAYTAAMRQHGYSGTR